jgi:predicted nucleic acid-binding protein
MIILDTNVVSETMKPLPDVVVLAWLNAQVAETLYLTSVTLAELYLGVAALPSGKRKERLAAVVEGQADLYAGRILSFDAHAAQHYAQLAMTARRRGRGFPTPDGYIAAMAAAHGFALATRDTAPFEAAGLKVINPWG